MDALSGEGNRYSSHVYLRHWVGNQKKVLDVGCGEGHQAADVGELGNQVTGIDCVDAPKREAVMRQYVKADLSKWLVPPAQRLEEREFDKILLMDIIEHLPDPAQVLRECGPLLSSKGQVILSLPNVADITVRLALLFGRWGFPRRIR
ncbi:MAG: methyltransferase domain-containing protein [Acidobacteria bacterium]|nr:methyltransferase domain-containing protein [Acidobacteriota bacterium]